MCGLESRLSFPNFCRLIIARHDALFIFKTGGVEFVFRQSADIGQKIPRPCDGFFFIVIAKRPIAEHLE